MYDIEADKNAASDYLVWLAVFAVCATVIQLAIPFPVDDDTAYHFSVARLIRQYGVLQSFPWTPFSWQATHYADKEFIFHLLFVPFTGAGFVTAARIVGAITGSAVLMSLYLVLRSEQVTLAGVWTLIPLASSVFMFRFALVRPHLLSLALAVIMLWALSHNRTRILCCCGVLYPLCYVAFWQIPLLLIVSLATARRISGRAMYWKPVIAVITGITAGIILHPNSVNLLRLNWIHMADILFSGAWKSRALVELGNEFFPYSWKEWFRFLAGTVIFSVAAAMYAWRGRKQYDTPVVFVIATMLFSLLTIKSMRFLEYFVPFSVLSLALATRSLKIRFIAPVLFGIVVIYTLLFGLGPVNELLSHEIRQTAVPKSTADRFARTIPEDAQIFTCSWDYTGGLMLVLPKRKFIVAADPTLFYLNDPVRYELWSRITELDPSIMASTIRTTFASRYVVCENSRNYEKLFNALSNDSTVTTLLVDNQWVFFDLGGASAQ